jgi:hypothetical protein
MYNSGILFCSNHKNIFQGNKLTVPVKGLLDQGFTGTQNIQKLFGKISTAHWPEPAADPACHDGYVMVFVHTPKSPEGLYLTIVESAFMLLILRRGGQGLYQPLSD